MLLNTTKHIDVVKDEHHHQTFPDRYRHQILRGCRHWLKEWRHKKLLEYTAIFLINGLCIVYCSLLQCLTLVYPGWGQKSEFFCLLVTTRRLQSGTAVGYRSTTAAYCWYTAAKGHWSTQGKGELTAPRCCVPGGHIQGHWGLFTVVPGSEGLRVVPHLPCTRQPVSFRST